MIKLLRNTLFIAFALFSFTVQAEGASKMPQVKLETSLGDIIIELNQEKAPETVANFLSYVEEGFYDSTIFHRVIGHFMVQGGGFDESFQQKATKDPIQNEADNGLSNKRGTIAMARTNDPHSATAQFFINVVDNDFLDFKGKVPSGWGYAVFAEVVEGMYVVDQIREVKTGMRGPHQDVPVDNVVIIKASKI